MSLQDWQARGWIEAHQTSADEITRLLRIADRDLKQSEIAGLSADWKLNIAYNAALQAATAALAAAGFRPRDHYYAIESLRFTIGAAPRIVTPLDRLRKKRNLNAYEQEGSTSDQDAKEALAIARQLCRTVKEWLAQAHPQLLQDPPVF